MNLFESKSKKYRSKPNFIKAAKYEKGMENGWVIEFCGEDFGGYDFKIFNTEEDAMEYYTMKPLHEVKFISNGLEIVKKYNVEYELPKPCLWHIETKKVADFDYSWEEQVYDIIEPDSWIMQWEGVDGLGIYNESYINSDWELDIQI
jgi:hypothetical protein